MTTSDIEQKIKDWGLSWSDKDERPWGAYWEIKEKEKFVKLFFPKREKIGQVKIIWVKEGARLSWQWHKNRAETWKIIEGMAGVMTSLTDQQPEEVDIVPAGGRYEIDQEMRHRILAIGGDVIMAEGWIGESKEDDITRIEDDFGRK